MLLYALSIMICQLSLMKASGESERGPGNVSVVADPEIVIHEDDRNFPIQHNYVVRRVEETLNLTCKIITQNENYRFKLSWDMPISSKNSKNRVMYNNKTNSLNLVIQHVQENDSGDYKCVALALTAAENRTNQFFNSVSVSVKSAKKQCGERHFTCPFGNCILQRYVCDGHPDCKNGEDEAEVYCGSYPCDGKITCEGRCIPMSWCCQPYNDLNCTVKSPPSCCQQIYKPYMEHDHPGGSYVSDQQRFSDINFLQTTIYTVIGCAMAFMLIVTILVIAICRVHMKRTLLTRYPPGGSTSFGPGLMTRPTANMHHNVHAEQHLPLCDLDVYLNRSPGLLVTYNINNGVQFVGHPVDPPPYCEVVASPPREGPPPPYASREDLESETSTLLQKPPNPSPSVIFSERTEEESRSPVNVQSSSCLTAPSTSQSSQLANSFTETICSHTYNSSSNSDSNGSNDSPNNSSNNNNNITVSKVDHLSADNQSVNSMCSDDDQHHRITITHTCVSNQEDNTSPSI